MSKHASLTADPFLAFHLISHFSTQCWLDGFKQQPSHYINMNTLMRNALELCLQQDQDRVACIRLHDLLAESLVISSAALAGSTWEAPQRRFDKSFRCISMNWSECAACHAAFSAFAAARRCWNLSWPSTKHC